MSVKLPEQKHDATAPEFLVARLELEAKLGWERAEGAREVKKREIRAGSELPPKTKEERATDMET